MRTTLQQLADHGQSPWIHHLTRDWIHDPDHGLPRLIRRGVTGAVSNPVALTEALSRTTDYDDHIRALLPLVEDSNEFHRQLVCVDARDACDLLLETAAGDKPLDGWIGVDVDPRFIDDAAATVEQAQWLAAAVGRPNLLVGITAAGSGLVAIEEATALGLSVLATGVYSPGRYRETALAYRRGLARLVAAGGDPATVISVASAPVAALDEKADLRLRGVGRHPELIGTLGMATAKLIRSEYLAFSTGPEWERLAAFGATPQRCLWSGSSVADGRQPSLRYAEGLIGLGSAALLSPHTAEAFLARGRVRSTLDQQLTAARRVLAAHVKAGVSPKLIVNALEVENVRRGAQAFGDVRALIDYKRAQLGVMAFR